MTDRSGFPFAAIGFGADGSPGPFSGELVPLGTTDVIVLAHGWKNDENDANALYGGILANVRRAAGGGLDAGGRRWAAVGVYWPAFRFLPDLSLLPDDASDNAGGATGLGDDDLGVDELRSYAAEVARELGAPDAAAFADLVVEARGGGAKADALADLLRGFTSPDADEEAQAEHAELLAVPGRELHAALRDGGSFFAASFDEAGEPIQTGGAASFERVRERVARLRSGGAAAVARLLNQATYFEMKARAGKVGAGLARELNRLLPDGARMHLVGHSFGGRLVTAAAAADGARALETLSLLQAAYSHNGLGTGFGDGGQTVGGFRRVVEQRRVAGPVLVTHTHRDTAVGFFYALASTVSGTIANAYGIERLMGGPKDPHGGMGANGAQSMRAGESVAHVAGGDPLNLRRGAVNNVLCDVIVSDHNDVANEAVGALVWRALSTT